MWNSLMYENFSIQLLGKKNLQIIWPTKIYTKPGFITSLFYLVFEHELFFFLTEFKFVSNIRF